jgi:hypothetical protein
MSVRIDCSFDLRADRGWVYLENSEAPCDADDVLAPTCSRRKLDVNFDIGNDFPDFSFVKFDSVESISINRYRAQVPQIQIFPPLTCTRTTCRPNTFFNPSTLAKQQLPQSEHSFPSRFLHPHLQNHPSRSIHLQKI